MCGLPDGVSFIASFFMEYSNSTPGFSSWYNTCEFIVMNWRNWSLLNGNDADHKEEGLCCWSKSPNTLRSKEGEGTSRLWILVFSLVVESCSCEMYSLNWLFPWVTNLRPQTAVGSLFSSCHLGNSAHSGSSGLGSYWKPSPVITKSVKIITFCRDKCLANLHLSYPDVSGARRDHD